MAEHAELVTEMSLLEKMSVQERLKHARKRRSQQLKRYAQYERDLNKRIKKQQSSRGPDGRKRRVAFAMNIQLLEAAARGDLDEVRKLLDNGVDPNMGNEDGLTALHQCCIDNNEAMMKVLVEHGADVNVTDRELWTPLHAASTCGHVNLAQYLISKGAALLAINSDGNMPYDICEDEVTLDYIESQMATQGITQEQIDELRERSPNQMLDEMTKLNDEGGDLEVKDDVGATPLHISAANGYDRVALFLLEHNADVHARDKDGWQPIHAAACWAHGDMIQLLVQHGADLDSKTDNAETPLTICEDEDLKGLMEQLKVEKMRRPPNLVRRSSSRSKRGSSIRRSSKRGKGEMSKKDAQGEAAIYFKQSSLTDEENGENGENGTDVPTTEVDDVTINTSEPSSPTAKTPSIELPDPDVNEDEDLPVPMPSIAEQPEGPESPSIVVHQNGIEEEGMHGHGPRKLKSILKRREDSDASLQSIAKRGGKTKRDSKEPELSVEEKQRIKEEKERERLRMKEQKDMEKRKQQEEKQKIKAERTNRKEQKRVEKEETKKKLKERKATQRRGNNESAGEDQAEQYYKEKMAGKETLAELKRQRSSHGKHSVNRTLSDASENEENSESPESMISPRKDSMDILNDQSPNHSMKRNSPNIARKLPGKLLLNRPSSGSYYLNEGSKQHDGEVNGVGDQSSLTTSNASIGLEDPPKKKFSSVGPENVFTPHENSRCCIVM